jgi:hypothetical protein
VLHWASFSAWHSGSPLSRLSRPHGTGWAGLTGPTGHSHDARAQRVATRHGVRADAHWVAAAVNSLAAIRATRQCNSGVWTMEAQGTHRAAPLRSGANEKQVGGEGDTSPERVTYPAVKRVVVAEKASLEFLHGEGSTSDVRRSSSRLKEKNPA